MHGKNVIKQAFTIPISQLHFHYGGVSWRRTVRELNRSVSITIVNYNIREEFDAVKDYFANALGTLAVQVTLSIEIDGGVATTIEAHSPEIESIGQDLIETVRFQYVKEAVRKKVKVETVNDLLTMESLFDVLSDKEVPASAFYANERELADDLLRMTETKHYQQLRYLSGRHAHSVMRLRFVLKPFSFLFLLEGAEQYHVVWETLDTEEATYVWTVNKDLAQLRLALKRVQDILQLVKAQGKVAYLSSPDNGCRRILHRYKEGIKGFIKWKDELESGLT